MLKVTQVVLQKARDANAVRLIAVNQLVEATKSLELNRIASAIKSATAAGLKVNSSLDIATVTMKKLQDFKDALETNMALIRKKVGANAGGGGGGGCCGGGGPKIDTDKFEEKDLDPLLKAIDIPKEVRFDAYLSVIWFCYNYCLLLLLHHYYTLCY